MILHWKQVPVSETPSIGERGRNLAALASIGLPIIPGFLITGDFLRRQLQSSELEDRFIELTTGTHLSADQAANEIRKLLLALQIDDKEFAPIQKALEDLQQQGKMTVENLFLSPSPAPGLPLQPGEKYGAFPRGKLAQEIPAVWASEWQTDFLEAVRKRRLDPFLAGGGLLLQFGFLGVLKGVLSTCNPKSKNPFELVLTTLPPDQDEFGDIGSQHILERNPLTEKCRIKRATYAHLNPRKNFSRLSSEQVITLGQQGIRAAERLRRPQRLSWILEKNRLFIRSTEAEVSPIGFFPVDEKLLELKNKERELGQSLDDAPIWTLASNYPLTPFGTSLDHFINQTLNEGIRVNKIPLPFRFHRYINGYRYEVCTLSSEPKLLERLQKSFRKSHKTELRNEFVDLQAPKLSELINVLDQQDPKKQSLKEDQQLLEKTLRIIMTFVADTSEIRGLLYAETEDGNSTPWKPYQQLFALGKRFQQAEILNQSEPFTTWDQVAAQILGCGNSEEIFQEIQNFQDDFGFLWRNGDPIDPGSEEDSLLLISYLYQAVGLEKDAELSEMPVADENVLTLSEMDHLLYRGISAFRRLLLKIGEKMKKAKIFPNTRDVFFVTYEELSGLLNASSLPAEYQRMLHLLIQDRKRAHARWKKLHPPFFLPSDELPDPPGKALAGKPLVQDKNDKPLEGVARIIRQSADLPRLQQGDICISINIDENWLPFLNLPIAIVTESSESNGLVRNELSKRNIPVILEVHNISRIAVEGSRVSVNPHSGKIQLMD